MTTLRTCLVVALLTVVATAARAFDVGGVIRALDRNGRVLTVLAGGRVRQVPISADARFLNREGKALPGGLDSPELREGAEVTLTVEPEGGRPVIRAIRLGLPAAGAPQAAPGAPVSPEHADLKPLGELGRAEYRGFPGGLYPDGKNERPAAHETLGLSLARQVRPLGPDGRPADDGRIVLLTIGMSNTSQSTQGFQAALAGEPARNPGLVLINGAQGGMTAARIQNPEDGASGTQYWSVVDDRLKQGGVTRAQVQAAWIKQADAGPAQGFPGYARTLQAELARIVTLLPGRFPNLKLVYLSSRTYGGYATTRLNPEPYAYESGFAVKWLIEQQLKGEPSLNCDPAKGPIRAPWLSWGPYLWANGERRRADGFSYTRADFVQDGTHQSRSGQQKVGELLLRFFKTDSTARGWFGGQMGEGRG